MVNCYIVGLLTVDLKADSLHPFQFQWGFIIVALFNRGCSVFCAQFFLANHVQLRWHQCSMNQLLSISDSIIWCCDVRDVWGKGGLCRGGCSCQTTSIMVNVNEELEWRNKNKELLELGIMPKCSSTGTSTFTPSLLLYKKHSRREDVHGRQWRHLGEKWGSSSSDGA